MRRDSTFCAKSVRYNIFYKRRPIHKQQHGALPYDNSWKYFLYSLIPNQSRWQPNYFIQRVSTNSGKKTISLKGAALWTKVEQTLITFPHGTLGKQFEDSLFLQNI